MSDDDLDPAMLRAWLAARSVARGLPAPVPDRGGFRVDTDSKDEIRRWVFPRVTVGLVELAHTLDVPRHLLKLCGSAADLRAALPDGWRLHTPAYFMTAGEPWTERRRPTGYAFEVEQEGLVTNVRVKSDTGDPAASGCAAETEHAFIYDRIVAHPEHRRRGLGSAIMAVLRHARRRPEVPQLLVATEMGRGLYLALGWRTLSPYSTASIADPPP